MLGANRREFLSLATATAALSAAGSAAAADRRPGFGKVEVMDPIKTELVMTLVVTCSPGERMGPTDVGPDGRRGEIWPIIGGRFEGPGIRGTVIAGGGDFPVDRPDQVTEIDALYRLRTDDGYIIIIHNSGIIIGDKARTIPKFIVNAGPYDWLNKNVFVGTILIDVPEHLRQAKGPLENDRIIQIHKLF